MLAARPVAFCEKVPVPKLPASERFMTPGVARVGAVVVELTTTPRTVALAPPVAVMLPASVAAECVTAVAGEVVVTVGATTAAAVVKSTLPPYAVPSVLVA